MPKRSKDRQPERLDAPTSENISFGEDDGQNVYAQSRDEGHRIDPRAQRVFIMCIVLVVLFFLGLLIPKNMLNEGLNSTGYGQGYNLSWFIQGLSDNVNGLIAFFTGNQTGSAIFSNTFFRYIVVCLSGAGLALCGAVYQGSFRNALVSPSTLGVMSGASLGMVIWIVFFVSDEGDQIGWVSALVSGTSSTSSGGISSADDLLATYGLSLLQFVGCAVVVVLVLLCMRFLGRFSKSNIVIIIVGQVVGGVCGAIVNTVRYYYVTLDPEGVKAQLLTQLQISSFYRSYSWIDVLALLAPLALCFAVIMHYRQKMMVLGLGEEEARTLGVETRKMRIITITVCTLLTAIIVSFAGAVGFVGFLIPHLSRRIVGPNFKYLLPAALVLGAIFVLGAYVLVSALFGSDYETMSGMYISIFGAIVFLVVALRNKGGERNGI
ncbi:MAG: FecCD family ABC transporter permease [Coriobacteriales bacterium]|jgi:iron complex transport system permease protein